jgi:hydrogenase maturation protease
MHGLALLDVFVGHDRAIVLDAIQTGQVPPGTVVEIEQEDLGSVMAPSPHFAGLPEMLAIADQLGLEFPRRTKIFAVEVVDLLTLGTGLTDVVKEALPELKQKVVEQLEQWRNEQVEPIP